MPSDERSDDVASASARPAPPRFRLQTDVGRSEADRSRRRSQAARIAALTRWGTQDPVEGTKPARAGFEARFLNQVPEGLSEVERLKAAERLKKAHMQSLALRSADARRRRKES